MEQLLHNKFQNKREHGEWFRLEIEDITSFKNTCQEIEKLIDIMKENPYFSKNLR
jgi:hypothetical protein